MKLTEITTSDPMRAAFNRGLMVGWINADLIERAGSDVRRSIVFYDADGMFVHAFPVDITRETFVRNVDKLAPGLESLGITQWSVGVL